MGAADRLAKVLWMAIQLQVHGFKAIGPESLRRIVVCFEVDGDLKQLGCLGCAIGLFSHIQRL